MSDSERVGLILMACPKWCRSGVEKFVLAAFVEVRAGERERCAAFVKWKIGTAECVILASTGELDRCGDVLARRIREGCFMPKAKEPS